MPSARSLALPVTALAAVYGACLAAAVLALPHHPAVGPAIAFDLTVTAAGAFWLLAVRPGHARPRALLPIVLFGLITAERLGGLRGLGAIAVLVEVVALGWLALRLRRVIAGVRTHRTAGLSFPAALEESLAAVLPARALAAGIAIEISAVTLAFTGWFRRPPAGFSMHRRTGYLTFFGVLLFLVLVETAGAHLVVSLASPTAAWILTGLSLYGLLWLLGDAHAVRLSPLRITPDTLVIEKGLRWRVTVPRAAIAAATAIAARIPRALDLSYLGPNLLLTLHTPVTARGLFGLRRSITQLTVGVDDLPAFLAAAGL